MTGGTNPDLRSRRFQLRLIASLLLPLIGFVVLLRVLGSATGALAITDAVPLLWVLAIGLAQHRFEPLGLIPVVVFAIALGLTILFGGSALPLELRRAVFPGAAGLACLISVAIGKPLLTIVATRLARPRPGRAIRAQPKLDTPGARKAMTALTTIIGITLVADASAQVVLAFMVSASTFGVVARIASWAIIGAGLGACGLYLRSVRSELRPAPHGPPSPGDNGPAPQRGR